MSKFRWRVIAEGEMESEPGETGQMLVNMTVTTQLSMSANLARSLKQMRVDVEEQSLIQPASKFQGPSIFDAHLKRPS